MKPTPSGKTRGAAESAIRTRDGGPKFFCRHCNQTGKSLNHIAVCGKPRRRS